MLKEILHVVTNKTGRNCKKLQGKSSWRSKSAKKWPKLLTRRQENFRQ